MNRIYLFCSIIIAAVAFCGIAEASAAKSPTEGTITADFVSEPQMKNDLLQMLADFSTYMKNDFQDCVEPNSIGEICGCFKGEDTMANNEKGVRPNADLSMICAFLLKYGKDKVDLPAGVSWDDISDLAMKSLVFAYSTHKANKLKVCKGNNYWGSTGKDDSVWESSLWAMSVAYSAFFQWDKLSDAQKKYIEDLLVAECKYELERSIPTGYKGDTKSEENGWEADILAATLGLFPDHELAPKWFERLREFAINSYSHPSDASDNTVIDPDYDNKTVADLYIGQNLFEDYTLQNHNLFHTSYQNVVMQELGEAALALKMFQLGLKGEEKWKTNALMHNNQKVQDEVLNWLALADGELAMPNGNDWSLFLYDQITSYSTMACFLRDPNALMLENLAYKYIQARQKTTDDGSWLLRADVGARRMGVEAHRVMMTYLMHEYLPTSDLSPATWQDFSAKYADAKIFPDQNVVRAMTDSRFTCFSWSEGLKSFTGYIASNSVDKNKIIVPLRQNGTGNFIGWYEVKGRPTNVMPVVSGVYKLDGNSYTMNGELSCNGGSVNNRFAIYSTPGNAVIYLDHVTAGADITIKKELGGLMAISVDPFMSDTRTLHTVSGAETVNGDSFVTKDGNWANIDDEVGFVTLSGKKFGFGDKSNNNSIMTARFYPLYSDTQRDVEKGGVIDSRNVVYYSGISAAETSALAESTLDLLPKLPYGWNGLIATDGGARRYLFLSNFRGDRTAPLSEITFPEGAPVFPASTIIANGKSEAAFNAGPNSSVSAPLNIYVSAASAPVRCVLDPDSDFGLYITTPDSQSKATIIIFDENGDANEYSCTLTSDGCKHIVLENGKFKVEDLDSDAFPLGEGESVASISSDSTKIVDVYSLDGMTLKKGVDPDSALNGLERGIYLVRDKKIAIN